MIIFDDSLKLNAYFAGGMLHFSPTILEVETVIEPLSLHRSVIFVFFL